ncbi:ketopantoate reductase family protein [Natronosporangium hydrolyticum]|uniref:Ketopantoate reductase family protein n=1 Tax=Natronosporangium hydrolyticum TaxID=2811111 RepID=A0A895YLA6_9ACTN|nr:2-dehydropantoate 2-reductase N-terminal domain-containing protein [Natronosporangium hydrolyticum]QSB16279.1 ketopantoate reductase family protein [Natronosporangium hydrolyticum]
MHYVIIGAGAVGGTIGGRLHQHGHRVTLVARGAQLAALRDAGLRLATPVAEHQLAVPVVAGPAELELTPDCTLILTVKSQDTVAALDTWADVPVRGGGVAGDRLPLVCAQNGVANEPAALRRFAQVYAACVWLPATYLAAGTVAAQGHPYSGQLQLGRYPEPDPPGPALEQLAADLTGSAVAASVRPDPMRWKYGKLLANLANGLDALFDERDPELLTQVRDEGAAVLRAAGTPHTTRAEEAAERGDRVELRPVAGQRRAGSSTRQSLARGAGSVEVDYLNGEIVLLGRRHGVETPANLAVQRAVRRAVHDGTAPGQFPVAEFRAILAASDS